MYYRSKNRPRQAQAQDQSQAQDQEQEQSDKEVDSGISIGMIVFICVLGVIIYVIFEVIRYWSRNGEEIRSLRRSLVPAGEFVVAQSPSPNSPSS